MGMQDTLFIEKKANEFLESENFIEASELFFKAGQAHENNNDHKSSSICFASAASCHAKALGETSFYKAAEIFQKAAQHSVIANDLEYASLLFKQAAICYERDMEHLGFSECYYQSKECLRKHLFASLLKSRKIKKNSKRHNTDASPFLCFFQLIKLSFSSVLWGHGERPQRTVLIGLGMIILFAVLYTQGTVVQQGVADKPDLLEAIYFSVITFTTVGYGDIVPLGFNKFLVVIEAFSGIFIVPIFITSLCRKYLRF